MTRSRSRSRAAAEVVEHDQGDADTRSTALPPSASTRDPIAAAREVLADREAVRRRRLVELAAATLRGEVVEPAEVLDMTAGEPDALLAVVELLREREREAAIAGEVDARLAELREANARYGAAVDERDRRTRELTRATEEAQHARSIASERHAEAVDARRRVELLDARLAELADGPTEVDDDHDHSRTRPHERRRSRPTSALDRFEESRRTGAPAS